MVFSSTIFMFIFLPMLLIIYFLIPNNRKNIVLLFASLLFYSWGEPKNIFLMILSIICNYYFALTIEKQNNLKRVILCISVFFNVGFLFIFKYLNFTIDILNRLLSLNVHVSEILLPIGISFYTFQTLSYVIDVYRGDVEAQHSILKLGLYVSLFPQLIAGPIVRYTDIEKSLNEHIQKKRDIEGGIARFAVGFSKKILIADQLSGLVDIAFEGKYPSFYTNWIGIIAYSLQILFDFSGYSDMAIGLGKIFGFGFPENFDYPYISKSVKEFWRRWHISLSTWFRDYVYIPLGGSHKGKFRTYINIIIVFFLTGLWHGASFNFIIWGLFYAFFLVVENIGWGGVMKKLPSLFQHVYSIVVIMVGWVFFRADNLKIAFEYLRGMIVPAGRDYANFNFIMNREYWFCIFIGIILCVPHTQIDDRVLRLKWGKQLKYCFRMTIFIIAISYMVGSGYSPFLYFRF